MVLRIGELAKQTGCNIETIRYYERIGMLSPPPRTPSGYRLYDAEHRRQLHFIRRARKLGFSLAEVRGLLGLLESDRYTCGEIQALALRHREQIREKIKDLQRLDTALTELVDQCGGGAVPACPIVDVLSGAHR